MVCETQITLWFDSLYIRCLSLTPQIVQENHYTPFGNSISDLDYYAGTDTSDYLYNGKELQRETNYLDYGARQYDPQIGRWHVQDPLAADAPGWTPYRYGFNNPISYTDPTGMFEDWVQNEDGEIYWDKNARSQATTKQGEKYLGKNLTFKFSSYIDKDLWDGPVGKFPAGEKLTSTINVTSNTDADNNLLSVDIKSETFVHSTGGIFKGDGYFPGQKNVALNIEGATSGSATFEQHAKVNGFEEASLGAMGYDAVNVAQKLTLGIKGNNLSVKASTDIFPSATLSVNGKQLFRYNQPSFKNTHGIIKDHTNESMKYSTHPTPSLIHLRPAPAFYERYKK